VSIQVSENLYNKRGSEAKIGCTTKAEECK
jgi:hypothetical protein